MTHRHAFEGLDRTLRDVTKNQSAFGGKVLVLGGDFRQILSVIPLCTPSQIIEASLNSSELWPQFEKFTLNKYMRVLRLLLHARNQALQFLIQYIISCSFLIYIWQESLS
jgi:hypothetical protein